MAGLLKRYWFFYINILCWVRWRDVCKPKNARGLGVRDFLMVNISLLNCYMNWLLDPFNSFVG
jgi:hypothetical protein